MYMKLKTFLLIGFIFFFCFPLIINGQHSDCSSAIQLCSKSSYFISSVDGNGDYNNEVTDLPCLPNFTFETNSVWFKWKIGKEGDLAFVLTPEDLKDDLDFVLYRLPNETQNCEDKLVLRCMSSGILLNT